MAIVPVLPEDALLLNLPFGGAVLKGLGYPKEEVDGILNEIRKKAESEEEVGAVVDTIGDVVEVKEMKKEVQEKEAREAEKAEANDGEARAGPEGYVTKSKALKEAEEVAATEVLGGVSAVAANASVPTQLAGNVSPAAGNATAPVAAAAVSTDTAE
mmetsp:Transcript_23104/g.41329  ORF Transcript_23104/g.41329 Transcript_23104/m.41329 type:complete len:157 (+) Transcript_23104:1-471(+)